MLFGKKTKTVTLAVTGMHCEHCVRHVTEALNAVKGVKAKVDLASGRAVVACPEDTPAEALVKAVEAVGFGASEVQ